MPFSFHRFHHLRLKPYNSIGYTGEIGGEIISSISPLQAKTF